MSVIRSVCVRRADSDVSQADGWAESTKDPEEARVFGSQGARGASRRFMMHLVCIGSLRRMLLTALLGHGHRSSTFRYRLRVFRGQGNKTLVEC